MSRLWIDAPCMKVCQGGRIASVTVTLAVGASEAEPFWTEFLRDLVRRGLNGVKLVISFVGQTVLTA